MWGITAAVPLLAARERGEPGAAERVRRELTATRPLVERLGLEAELHGHEGCVNCLEWNADGSVLASASDDLRIILWDWRRRRPLCTLVSGHAGNIFSVKFVSEGRVATCAADCSVRVRDAGVGDAPLLVCGCHRGRVKRLAAPAHDPHLLWSAAEDGLVLQHDLRAPHVCGRSRNVVVDLRGHVGSFAEAKCVAASPTRPHHLALGANDFYVRLYDMRMIKLSGGAEGRAEGGGGGAERRGETDGVTRAAAKYFAPGHLSTDAEAQSFSKMVTTYVAFSGDGNELLVNLGSEQVYVFDVNRAPRPRLLESYIIRHNHGRADSAPRCSVAHAPSLPAHVAALKEAANECVHSSRYAEAVALYSEAIAAHRACAVLYSNRATALLRRAWAGDAYAAVRDCYTAIDLDPAHLKSHFRLAKALMELQRAREAHEVLLYFKSKFREHANSHAVRLLARDVAVALQDRTRSAAEEESESGEASSGASAVERALRATTGDYSQRFLGHCNVTTDIKEANFVGAGYVAAGSDDGALLVWSRATGALVRALRADESILNCVQPHPACCLLATSGIESVVRLWSPRPDDGSEDARAARPADLAAANQLRMRADPFESMLLNAGGPRDLHALPCRPS